MNQTIEILLYKDRNGRPLMRIRGGGRESRTRVTAGHMFRLACALLGLLVVLSGCTHPAAPPLIFGAAEPAPYSSREVAPELSEAQHNACAELFGRWRVRRSPTGVKGVCGGSEECLLYDSSLAPVAFIRAGLPTDVDLAQREHAAGHALSTCACGALPQAGRPDYCFRDGPMGTGGAAVPDNRDIHHRAPWWPCVYYGRANVLAQDRAYCDARAH